MSDTCRPPEIGFGVFMPRGLPPAQLMPEIELVDLADKYKRKRMKGHFSDRMLEEMTETLLEGHQIILFQNRRQQCRALATIASALSCLERGQENPSYKSC